MFDCGDPPILARRECHDAAFVEQLRITDDQRIAIETRAPRSVDGGMDREVVSEFGQHGGEPVGNGQRVEAADQGHACGAQSSAQCKVTLAHQRDLRRRIIQANDEARANARWVLVQKLLRAGRSEDQQVARIAAGADRIALAEASNPPRLGLGRTHRGLNIGLLRAGWYADTQRPMPSNGTAAVRRQFGQNKGIEADGGQLEPGTQGFEVEKVDASVPVESHGEAR